MIIDEPEPQIKLKENITLTEYESILIKKLLLDYYQKEDISALSRLIEISKQFVEIDKDLRRKLIKYQRCYNSYHYYEKVLEKNPSVEADKYDLESYINWKQAFEIRSRGLFNIILTILKKLNFDFSMINLIDTKASPHNKLITL